MAQTDIEWTHTVLPVGFKMPNGTILTEPLVIKGYTMNAWSTLWPVLP